MDEILDFPAGDRVDLRQIDATATTPANNHAFTYVGAAAFSGTAGELRAVQDGSGWIVEADIDGDGAADLMIAVTTTGGHMLGAGDFLM